MNNLGVFTQIRIQNLGSVLTMSNLRNPGDGIQAAIEAIIRPGNRRFRDSSLLASDVRLLLSMPLHH
jgi:hypothetical protein